MNTRNEEIIHLYNTGIRPTQIAARYDIGVRQVQRILYGTGTQRPKGKSTEYKLKELRDIIIALMKEQGRDFTTCEICNKPIPKGKFDIHHTKYEGATYYDLQIVCRLCNTAPLNRYLE